LQNPTPYFKLLYLGKIYDFNINFEKLIEIFELNEHEGIIEMMKMIFSTV
jgi:hypothetical protein